MWVSARARLEIPMSEEAQEAQEVQETEETVADTEEAQSESVAEPEETEQVTEEPEPIPEKVYTKSELDEIMTRRVAREKRKLQREFESKEPKEVPVKNTGEPDLDDYEDTTEWIKDRTDWAVKQEREKHIKSQQDAEAEKLNAAYQKQQSDAAIIHADYWDAMEVLEDYGDIPPYLNEAVVTSDIGGELSYFLAKNPEEVDRIIGLSPTAAVKAIARIEDKLTTSPRREISKAPAPAPKVNTGGRVDSLEYKKDMSFEDFQKLRNRQLGRN